MGLCTEKRKYPQQRVDIPEEIAITVKITRSHWLKIRDSDWMIF